MHVNYEFEQYLVVLLVPGDALVATIVVVDSFPVVDVVIGPVLYDMRERI